MTRITKPYRGQRAVKRLDLSDLRELLRDRRTWVGIGIVTVPDGAATHFEQTDTDILVDVVLQPSLHDVTCRLSGGVWAVPAVGEEVVVTFPEGAMDFMPTIQGILSSGAPPTATGGGAQPPTPTRIAIVRTEVVVHDGPGGAEELVKKGEFNTFRAWVEQQFKSVGGHSHVVSGAATTTTNTVAVVGGGSPTVPVPAITGTTVLKAK